MHLAPAPFPAAPAAASTADLPPAQAEAATDLLRFNRRLLDQALALTTALQAPGAPDYERPVGAHLRHVIEHYEALVLRPAGGMVSYDHRPRDRELERCPQMAGTRLQALQLRLFGWTDDMLELPVLVCSLGGLHGEHEFINRSTLGRELVFLASHAVHHFALLGSFCQQHGLLPAEHFGVAPSTVANTLRAS
jgi:hypothetical protein